MTEEVSLQHRRAHNQPTLVVRTDTLDEAVRLVEEGRWYDAHAAVKKRNVQCAGFGCQRLVPSTDRFCPPCELERRAGAA